MPNYADDILEVFDNFMAIYTDGSTDSFYDIMVIYEDVCGWSPADSMMEGDYKKVRKRRGGCLSLVATPLLNFHESQLSWQLEGALTATSFCSLTHP